MPKIPVSVLELATVVEGSDAAGAIASTVAVAQKAESSGFARVWLAEHHNMPHIASSATAVLIGHVAGHTRTVRVGSGGIMLPNHAPLVIAEQFGTLETLYPGRIDLGLGRAPGTDQLTAAALRRNNMDTSFTFPRDVVELQRYFSADNHTSKVRAFPAEGLHIPIWILGSSTDSAVLAAQLGLPYAFAAHFAPAQLRAALRIYREQFKPSAQLARPYAMACVNVIAADTDEEAVFLSTSLYRLFLGILTNHRKPLQPPGELPAEFSYPEVRGAVENMTACTFVGGPDSLRRQLDTFIGETEIDELMVASHIFDLGAKLRSLELLAAAMEQPAARNFASGIAS